MKNIYRSLLSVIAGATQRELARQIKYLKVENEILRKRLPALIHTTPAERNRLVRFAKKLGRKVLHELVSIVHPATACRWIREHRKSTSARPSVSCGRPMTPLRLRQLILRMARENDWGYTRILGEIKKLGISPPSRNTVKAILKRGGLEPGPRRGEGTWDEFLKQHAASLWQCDFFSRNVITPRGLRQAFVLAFIHVSTRRVILSPATYEINADWVEEQANQFVTQARSDGLPVTRVMRDHDNVYRKIFDTTLRRKRVKVKRLPFRAPNTNAFIERLVQTIKQECLDHFIVFGLSHFNVLCREYLIHYHFDRPHQSKDNEVLIPTDKREQSYALTSDFILCRTRLGGLLKSYHRRAA